MSLPARPRAARFTIPILLAALWTVAPGNGESNREWTTSSFMDFVDGALTDGGANTYVGADGTVRLINLWDLNDDGQLDLLFPSSHDHNEKVDLFIYWGRSGFDPAGRTRLPSNGGKAVAIADLNQDRQPDLIVVNRFNGTRSDLDSYIYWGSRGGFEPGRRTLLPTRGAEAVAVADLNGDGWKEVVFANSGLSYHVPVDRFNRSFIYWGAASGYSPDRRTSLKTVLARDVEIADLDRDGVLDLVFASEGNEDEESGAWIYWGDGSGDFSGRPPTRLPGQRSAAVAATDLNGDGWTDLVLANRFRLRAREMGIYNIIDTVAVDSYVYWGSREGYAAGKRTELPTVAARDVEAADLNGDGRPDLVFANGAGGASYIYWASDSGFHPHKRSALPTSEAAGVEVGDINRDGSPDLVFAQRGDRRTEDGGSLIYWGNSQGFSRDRRQTLPTWEATGIAIGDLDSDGRTDLVFANKSDGNRQVPSLLYWGAPKGRYSREARLELGSGGADAYAAADVNRDGFPDLFLPEKTKSIYWGGREPYSSSRTSKVDSESAISGRFADLNRDGYLDLALSEWQPGVEQTSLLWGGPGDYSRDNRFVFEVGGLRHHHLADLDRNGWLDIIFTSTTNRELFIYWNGPQGFDNTDKTRLPTGVCATVEVADLNGDGYLEIVVPNLFDPNPSPDKPQSFGGSPQGNTFIYWGGPEGYSPASRQILPSIGNADVAVADLDRDGRLDLVLTSYHAGHTRSHPSTIYWNSAQGFQPERFTRLPTHSASGVLVADFDRNGHEDILFSCHSRDGNHRNQAFLYWGGAAGFSTDRRSQLPVLGPHFLSVIDIGHIYDRGDRYDFISPAFDGGPRGVFSTLAWKGDTPWRTGLEFQLRAAETRQGLADAPWQGPKGPHSFYRTSPSGIEGLPKAARWIQYKASLISPDSANSPVLRSVSVGYRRQGE